MTLPTEVSEVSEVSAHGSADVAPGAAPSLNSRDGAGGDTDVAAPLSALEMEAWSAFSRSRTDLNAALERDLKPTGLSLGDYQVFVFLIGSDAQSMRMCDLADELGLSPSGLTRRLDGLVKAGWIERQSAEHDRRVMLAVVTADGRRTFEQAVPVYVASVRRRITSILTEDELRSMADIFVKIRLALNGPGGG